MDSALVLERNRFDPCLIRDEQTRGVAVIELGLVTVLDAFHVLSEIESPEGSLTTDFINFQGLRHIRASSFALIIARILCSVLCIHCVIVCFVFLLVLFLV